MSSKEGGRSYMLDVRRISGLPALYLLRWVADINDKFVSGW